MWYIKYMICGIQCVYIYIYSALAPPTSQLQLLPYIFDVITAKLAALAQRKPSCGICLKHFTTIQHLRQTGSQKKTKNPSSLFDGISFLLLITFRWGTFFGMKHLRYFLCTSISLSIPSDIIRSSHIWKPHIGDLGNPLFVQSSWMNPWSFLGLDLGVPDLIWLPAAMEIHVLSISKECSSVNIHMAFEVRFRSW